MSHPLVLALFDSTDRAADAAKAVRALGVRPQHLSIVARSHMEEGRLSREFGGSPGVDIEDSRLAARLGELSGQILAAIAVVMPGIGPIVAAGPLAADFGEAAGHAAGSIQSILERAGVAEEQARRFEERVDAGTLLVGVHAIDADVEAVRAALAWHEGEQVVVAAWDQA